MCPTRITMAASTRSTIWSSEAAVGCCSESWQSKESPLRTDNLANWPYCASVRDCTALFRVGRELVVQFLEPVVGMARVVLLGDTSVGMAEQRRDLGELRALVEQPGGDEVAEGVRGGLAQQPRLATASLGLDLVGQRLRGAGHDRPGGDA